MKKLYSFILFFVLVCIASNANAQAGLLDSSFNGTGHKTINQNNNYGYAKSVAVQADGKILVVGYGNDYSYYNNFTIYRLNPDGSADNTFGDGGRVSLNPSDYYYNSSEAKDVAVQTDGKIVVVGSATNYNGYQSFAAVRLNTDGSLDNGFGNGGKVVTDNGYDMYSQGESVALDTDGKIVIAGMIQDYSYNYYYGYNYGYGAVRLNSDGSIDNNFGNEGKFNFVFPRSY